RSGVFAAPGARHSDAPASDETGIDRVSPAARPLALQRRTPGVAYLQPSPTVTRPCATISSRNALVSSRHRLGSTSNCAVRESTSVSRLRGDSSRYQIAAPTLSNSKYCQFWV